MAPYTSRPIRFIELFKQEDWTIKLYSISDRQEFVSPAYIVQAKQNLNSWLQKSKITPLEIYKIATLIFHECKDGCFAVINWWIDDNMLQHYVYLAKSASEKFEEFSSRNGISTCAWELSILWFERNAWVKYVLTTGKPNFEAYLNEHLNED